MSQKLFQTSHEYDDLLQQGLRLSGEDKHYFIRGRVNDLRGQLPPGFQPRRILDLGCGTGDTTRVLAQTYSKAEVVGVDPVESALALARERHTIPRVSFARLGTFFESGGFELCYVNGVFHHVPPQERVGLVRMIWAALTTDGYFSFFENNPWNPGTRMVMRRIPFDREAIPVSPREARRILTQGGFHTCWPTRYLFYFPRPLSLLRFSESWLARFPLGAQYHILAVKKGDD